MSLTTCRLCGGSVSTLALECPVCLEPPDAVATGSRWRKGGRASRFLAPITGGVAVAIVSLAMLLLGSGILPVPEALLLAGALVTGSGCGLLSAFVAGRWRLRWSLLLTVALVVPVVFQGFRVVVDKGLLEAERYAEQVALRIEHQVAATGRWPAALSEVSGLREIPAPQSPFLSFRDDQPKVAGFFLVYSAGPPPRLEVIRRGYGAEYDWPSKGWRRVSLTRGD